MNFDLGCEGTLFETLMTVHWRLISRRRLTVATHLLHEAQLMLTNPRDAFTGQSWYHLIDLVWFPISVLHSDFFPKSHRFLRCSISKNVVTLKSCSKVT